MNNDEQILGFKLHKLAANSVFIPLVIITLQGNSEVSQNLIINNY